MKPRKAKLRGGEEELGYDRKRYVKKKWGKEERENKVRQN